MDHRVDLPWLTYQTWGFSSSQTVNVWNRPSPHALHWSAASTRKEPWTKEQEMPGVWVEADSNKFDKHDIKYAFKITNIYIYVYNSSILL